MTQAIRWLAHTPITISATSLCHTRYLAESSKHCRCSSIGLSRALIQNQRLRKRTSGRRFALRPRAGCCRQWRSWTNKHRWIGLGLSQIQGMPRMIWEAHTEASPSMFTRECWIFMQKGPFVYRLHPPDSVTNLPVRIECRLPWKRLCDTPTSIRACPPAGHAWHGQGGTFRLMPRGGSWVQADVQRGLSRLSVSWCCSEGSCSVTDQSVCCFDAFSVPNMFADIVS